MESIYLQVLLIQILGKGQNLYVYVSGKMIKYCDDCGGEEILNTFDLFGQISCQSDSLTSMSNAMGLTKSNASKEID